MEVFYINFYAKSNKETIQEHTDNLLKQFQVLCVIYENNINYLNKQLLYYACLYHDLGKINSLFQIKVGNNGFVYLFKINKEIYHEHLSCAFLDKKELKNIFEDMEVKILYQSIYYSHNRKINISDNNKYLILKEMIEKDLSNNVKDFKYDKLDNITLNSSFRSFIKERITRFNTDKIDYLKYVTTKGLLNKIDYAASAYIDVEIKPDTLEQKTIDFIKGKFSNLNSLQQHMLLNQDKNNIIIGSTGLGKTEAGFIWIGNNKGMFTLPLKSTINTIYDRAVNKIGVENVSLLHSETLYEYLQRNNTASYDDELESKYIHTKQLSYPLTITTLDQLIKFVFRNRGYELKLATLSYSKLIIDEIQMYSPEMLGYLICALKDIDSIGGKFTIMTATFPPFLLDLMKRENINIEDPKEFLTDKIRHRLKVLNKEINIEDILKSDYKNKKILVIVNTIKKAQELYDKLKGKVSNLNLYHSRFIKMDKSKKEMEILYFGNKDCKDSGIWITTQVAENSLDIDFDILFTELSELTSLFQRMGRVFRLRLLCDNNPNIYLYTKDCSGVKENFEKSIIDKFIFNLSKVEISKYNDKVISEQDKIDMINNIYRTDKIKGSEYYNKILRTISYISYIEESNMNNNDTLRSSIKNKTIIPLEVYNNNIVDIEDNFKKYKTSSDFIEREIYKNEILKYTVEVPIYITEYTKLYNRMKLNKYTSIDIIDIKYNIEKGCYL